MFNIPWMRKSSSIHGFVGGFQWLCMALPSLGPIFLEWSLWWLGWFFVRWGLLRRIVSSSLSCCGDGPFFPSISSSSPQLVHGLCQLSPGWDRFVCHFAGHHEWLYKRSSFQSPLGWMLRSRMSSGMAFLLLEFLPLFCKLIGCLGVLLAILPLPSQVGFWWVWAKTDLLLRLVRWLVGGQEMSNGCESLIL